MGLHTFARCREDQLRVAPQGLAREHPCLSIHRLTEAMENSCHCYLRSLVGGLAPPRPAPRARTRTRLGGWLVLPQPKTAV